jgi:4-diphosphocytidyl-2-C-methyl-D-erythritol kinase
MVTFPSCKINLGLNIIHKRGDGFHDLETCFYPVPFTDALEIILSEKFSFSCTGNLIPGEVDDNLCVRAFRLIQGKFNIGNVNIHLHKVIPSGAGLGGGSSDAASTLTLLNNIFELNLSETVLADFASSLGSDCAFFIHNKPMMGSGRGEILHPVELTLKDKFLVIIKPDIHISTADAFAAISPHKPEVSITTALQSPIHQWRNILINDFETSVFKKHPVLKSIKESLYNTGAIYASMSGSGSAIYGLFDDAVDLHHHLSNIVWSGRLV